MTVNAHHFMVKHMVSAGSLEHIVSDLGLGFRRPVFVVSVRELDIFVISTFSGIAF